MAARTSARSVNISTKFTEQYHVGEELGKGGFSVVHKCIKIDSNKEFAVKVIQMQKLSIRERHRLEVEARICKKLDHPNIVKLNQVISENQVYYLVFDLVTGGELFDDLATREDNYTEDMAATCMEQLLDAVMYCHAAGVVHRDLKPENILLESKESKNIKLADFGLAIEVTEDECKWFGYAGTPNYMAPELVEKKPYGRPIDVWACGVVMYILLAGFQPFVHPVERGLHHLIKTGDYDLTSEVWEFVTEDAKDLIRRLLCVVPSHRLTAAEALQHPWFQKVKTDGKTHRKDTVDNLKHFNARRKFKAAVHSSLFIYRFLPGRKKAQSPESVTSTSSSSSVSKGRTSKGGK